MLLSVVGGRSGLLAGALTSIGGIGGPVAAGRVLPLDGDLDVNAEHPGEDRGGDLGGEGEQGGGPVLLGPNVDLVQPLTDLAVAERPAWLSAGEEPWDVVRSADLGLAASGRDELADQGGQRHREDDGRGSEGDRNDLAVDADIIDGELADGCDLLCVEDQ